MSKIYSILGVLILTMGVTLCGWAANPCKPIAEACMKEGYYKGGNKVGKGLIENCVMPVVANKKQLSNATFGDSDRQACKVLLEQKMKEKQTKS